MTWCAQVVDVRWHNGGQRWTLVAWTPDVETRVCVDTTQRGTVVGLQSDGYVNGTGDDELDHLVADCIRREITTRHVHQRLDGIDRGRWGRIQQPADRRRWAA